MSASFNLVECSECGDDHFDTVTRTYFPCPMFFDGCPCPFGAGDVAAQAAARGH